MGLGYFLRCSVNIARIQHATIRMASSRSVIAIRREDHSVWERRAPLAPDHVRHLVKDGSVVIIQPSNRRAFSMEEYRSAGAIIDEDISSASLILGVKQVPIDTLIPEKTYAFFSHTIKAQEANMPLLDALLEKRIRLIEYEKMADERGIRTVAFGKYAGVAGMINILHGLGLRLLALGHHTPFIYIGPTHNYRNSEMARQAIREAGYQISLGMMPASIGPLTFVFTGSGNVSQGAQEVFRELPVEFVDPQHLETVATKGSMNKVYGCVVDREDHLVRKEGGRFDGDEFTAHPERYASNFSRKIAPYASVLINGIYYAPNDPRLISIPNCKQLLEPQKMPWIPSSPGCPTLPHRFLALCDISADPGGSLEFMQECTTIDHPFLLYDAASNTYKESFSGPGVLICSIDNMPAQIPREATSYFGSLLLPYISDMQAVAEMKPLEETTCSPVISKSVITTHGQMTPDFQYISELRQRNKETAAKRLASSTKKVLVLGAGYVSAPCVQYLTESGISVTVASALRSEVDALASRFENTIPTMIDIIRDAEAVEKMIAEHDITISLLPYSWHPTVAKMCIRQKRDMVTASYLSPEMQDLHRAAMDAGVTIVNEVGVDPGIDHLLAMDCFREVDQRGGKIESFISWCGGLPAADFSDNPLRYLFSWSPKAVLLNLKGAAQWLENNQIMKVAEGGSLLEAVKTLEFLPGFNLEGIPNRDSTVYKGIYGINDVHTIQRGTIRFRGFCEAAKVFVRLNLIDTEPVASLHPKGPQITWKEFMAEKLNLPKDTLAETVKDRLFTELDQNTTQFKCIVDLGLISDEEIEKKGTAIDTLSNYLNKRLAFGEKEYDMIIMRHDVGICWPDGKREIEHVDLVVYGDQDHPGGFSAMAKTVGFPTAIATKMVLEGEIQRKGMVLPLTSDIYLPMIARLKEKRIISRTHSTTLSFIDGCGGLVKYRMNLVRTSSLRITLPVPIC